jgi:hypothetical protein
VRLNGLKNIKSEINASAIEVYSNKRILIFDCKSIIDYSPECMVIDLGGLRLKITGEALMVESFVFEQTDIRGEIYGLEFV